jgi:putative glutamine amidotransferase
LIQFYDERMSTPLIGVSGRRAPSTEVLQRVPVGLSHVPIDIHFTSYTSSIASAGGIPVELARDVDPEAIVERLDGLVLSGGADLDPALYGAEPDERLGPVEHERDAWEFGLLAAARQRGIPVLAVCRGCQLVNVAFGGTLIQHVSLDEGSGHPNWNVDGRLAAHDVLVVAGTLASTLYPSTWPVNSLHHQTLDEVGEGLRVGARAPDGVIEAVETDAGDLLAVQWHPELMKGPDPAFLWLVQTATKAMH